MPTKNALVKGGVALCLGVILLGGSGGTLAGWTDKTPVGQGTLAAGAMTVSAAAPTYTITRTDLKPTATSMTDTQSYTIGPTTDASTVRMVPGDTVTVSVTVTVTADGKNAKGTLNVNPAALTSVDASLQAELTNAANGAGTASIAPVGAAPALASAGTNSWTVTNASNGAQYTVSMPMKVRSTRDGLAPSGTRPGNWWETTLQGSTANSRTLPITLTQTL